jgi:exonuclease VII small subunit
MAIYKKRGELDKSNEEYKKACELYPGVKDMITESEISLMTPTPQYSGQNVDDGKGLHPSLETRIKQAEETISTIRRGKDE